MRPPRAETRAGREPPSRQTLQIPRWRGPTAFGPRGTPGFPPRAPGVSARFRHPCGFGRSRPFSVRGARPGFRAAVGNCELEGSAPPDFRFHPDPPTLALDNLLTKSRTDASAGNFASMKAFEHAKHPVGVVRIDTDSVVPHRKYPPFRVFLRRDLSSRDFLASVLDRIGNQVLEKLRQQDLFGHHSGQRPRGYHGAIFGYSYLEI